MKFNCIIFDLDGTLVDTLEDIAASMNRALESRGFPPVPPEQYAGMVGWGIKRLALLALPPEARDEKNAGPLAAAAVRFYTENPLVYSRPYPEIPRLVEDLKRLKVKTAVLTNKPDPVARLVIDGLFPAGSFNIVLGEKPGVPRKPDPASVWDILMRLDSTPRNTIFAGDSEIDMETARAAECHALGVSWGFRSRAALKQAGAERIVDSPGEILNLIKDTRI
ncbi:MAG: HAD family hydrolase [Spirochaetaceae bacterium]|jgi:phosphoglycolate phosphatase|nr:HAD family hydrolase [Spirochaetaceae bacterium]